MNIEVRNLGNNLLLIRKSFQVLKTGNGSDITGPYWMLMRIRILAGSMAWKSNGKFITPKRKSIWLFVPPYSWSVEFCPRGTEIEVECIMSALKPPTNKLLPTLLVSNDPFPGSFAEAETVLKNCNWKESVPLCSVPSGTAERLKKLMDKNFSNSKTFGDFAKLLKTSEAVISRQFKQSFGFPPTYYRRGLRSTVGMYELMRGHPPAEAAALAGYRDLGRFYKEFGKYMKATPAKFKTRSKYSRKSKNAKI